jgi:hypothetical protein
MNDPDSQFCTVGSSRGALHTFKGHIHFKKSLPICQGVSLAVKVRSNDFFYLFTNYPMIAIMIVTKSELGFNRPVGGWMDMTLQVI